MIFEIPTYHFSLVLCLFFAHWGYSLDKVVRSVVKVFMASEPPKVNAWIGNSFRYILHGLNASLPFL